ncbi:MAG: hypothetical protein AAGH72_07335 [Verrucomicrobiota bacterium]
MADSLDKFFLRRSINDFVGEGYGYIPRWALRVYGKEDWDEIRNLLKEWQESGFLEVLKDPEHCGDDAYCLKMFNFIDAEEPLPDHWISYDRQPPQYQMPS